ncbi:MAG: CPXCG motif-containing cysteine-rich protein [Chlorobiaceae bacterium]|nr:CPXCG motif-containing cysteine-rich protein [Chlorobiaceae bacterium]
MEIEQTVLVQCPYCAECFEVLVECSIAHQEYIEDCEVCCRPVTIVVDVAEDGSVSTWTRSEDV